MSDEIKPQENKNLQSFLEEYRIICKRYGLMIAGELKYAKTGIYIEPVVVEQETKMPHERP